MSTSRPGLRLLLVEDDEPLGSALAQGLRLDGHQVTWLQAGRLVEATLLANRFEAVLLDLWLPDCDGQDILRAMRRRRDRTPVIVISARGDRNDRIDLLDVGADDYLVKPVDLGELEARLRAVTRRSRSQAGAEAVVTHGALQLEEASGGLMFRGRRLVLRERERAVLELFLMYPDRVFSRVQIEAEIFGPDAPVESNAVEVHVHHLRRKITSDVIITVRRQGYRLGPPPAGTER